MSSSLFITYIDDLEVIWYFQIFGTIYEFYNYFPHLSKFGYKVKTCIPACLLLIQYLCNVRMPLHTS